MEIRLKSDFISGTKLRFEKCIAFPEVGLRKIYVDFCMIIIFKLTFISTTMEKCTTLEFITWMHNAHLCWMSSVDPSFHSYISATNLLTANSVLGAFRERCLTNVIFIPIAEMQTPTAMNRQVMESVRSGQF
jgi:hypothetical protein